MKNLPVRKKLRLTGYSYSDAGCCFVAICTKNGEFMFGNIADKIMRLSEYGEIVKTDLLNIPKHYDNVKIDNHVIMPNHLHMIISLTGAGKSTGAGRASASPTALVGHSSVGAPLAAPAPLTAAAPFHAPLANIVSPIIGNIVRGYKSGVSRNIGFSLWQRSFHDHIIRNETEYQRIWQYIDENPARWPEDCYFVKT